MQDAYLLLLLERENARAEVAAAGVSLVSPFSR
jgi:hypothetical protein